MYFPDIPGWWPRLARFTAVAAVAHAYATLQLQQLEALTVSEAPDLWSSPSAVADTDEETVAQALAEVLARDKTSAIHPTLSISAAAVATAAAAAAHTLDDWGCWLLQQHPALQWLHISTANPNWGMSWLQKQQANSMMAAAAALILILLGVVPVEAVLPELLDISIHCAVSTESLLKEAYAAAGEDAAEEEILSKSWLVPSVSRTLTRCSSRPAALLHEHIISCHLILHTGDILFHDGLAVVLRDMQSLKHLQVKVSLTKPLQVGCGATRAATGG